MLQRGTRFIESWEWPGVLIDSFWLCTVSRAPWRVWRRNWVFWFLPWWWWLWERWSLFLGSYWRSSDILSPPSRKSLGTVRCSIQPSRCTAGLSLWKHKGVLYYKWKQVCLLVWRARLVCLYELAVTCVFLLNSQIMMDVQAGSLSCTQITIVFVSCIQLHQGVSNS